MKSFIKIFVMIFLTSVQIFGLTNNEIKQKDSNYITIIDSRDREILLSEEPQRVVSLAPSITQIIFSLGAENKLVGRTDYCTYPDEASKIDSIGTLLQPSLEKIVELNPDVIIASTHFSNELLIKLTELNLKVIIVDEFENLEGLYKNINSVGLILNKVETAKNKSNEIKEKIDYISEKVAGLNKPKVYYVVGYGEYGDYTAGGNTFISELIELAGGENIAKDSIGWSYSLEKIVEKNPEIIICSKYFNAFEGIKSSTGYKDLPSIKNNKLFTIDNNLIDIFGPRAPEGLEALARIIHPEIF